ncbi:hypothetical protein BKA82DRAFT_3980895, partial [Pisolithus tinctorius]
LISQENNRFILHDSRGFEPAEGSNYDVVKSFIEERKRMPDVKDQLHTVWLCFQVLKYGERLLEDGVEAFLREANEALGNIPTIVVFTKYDRLVSFVRKKSADPEAEAKRYLQTYCIEPIQDFTGGTNISHVAASCGYHFINSLLPFSSDITSETQVRARARGAYKPDSGKGI